MNPPSTTRGGGAPLFTSTKLPPGPGQSCELPLGLLYTPFASEGEASDVTRLTTPPAVCGTCWTYANLYAATTTTTTTSSSTNNRWTCPLCGSENVLPGDNVSNQNQLPPVPTYEFLQPLDDTGAAATATTATSSTTKPSTESINEETIILVVDAHLPAGELRAVGQAVADVCGPSEKTITWGMVVFDEVVAVYRLGGAANAEVPCAVADVVTRHTTWRPQDTAVFLSSAVDAVDRIQHCLEALAAVHDDRAGHNNNHNGSSATTATSTDDNPPLSRLERLKRAKAARQQGTSSTATTSTVSSALVTSPWVAATAQERSTAWRCTGEALQVALDLASTSPTGQSTTTTRLWTFTNGCPNLGDGSVVLSVDDDENTSPNNNHSHSTTVHPLVLARAVEFYTILAESAIQDKFNILMDVFLSGVAELGWPAFAALVAPSAGYALVHESLASPHLRHHLRYVWESTYNCGTSNNNEITVDVRHASFLTPTHFCGPGVLVADDADKTLTAADRPLWMTSTQTAAAAGLSTRHWPHRETVETTLVRWRLGRVDPLSTLSVMFQYNDFFQKDDVAAIFQCITRYRNRAGTHWVVRVSTHRLAVATDVGAFLDAVDEDVVPVVLAKEAVYRSLYGREASANSSPVMPLLSASNNDDDEPTKSEEQLEQLAYATQLDLDATVARISHAYRLLGLQEGRRGMDLTEEGGVRAAGTSLDFAFPPELGGALKRLYHFRRGPLLSPGPMRSTDDRLYLRSLFLRMPLDECLLSMAPSIWMLTDPQGPIQSVPADTLALWDSAVLVADNFHALFIWSGRNARQSEELQDLCNEFLAPRAWHRFPLPDMHVLTDGDSMSRRFTALLSPSHGDPIEHSLTNFPCLSSLPPDALAELQSKFPFYDASTDPSFRSWFWTISSATSRSKDEGWSLCE